MKSTEDLKEILEDWLKKIGKKEDITPQELEYAYKAIDILKDIETIKAMREAGYSNDGQMSRNSYNSYDGSYDGYYQHDWRQDASHNSYARYGRDGDGDGRYSEDSSYDYSTRRGRDTMGRFTSRDSSYDYSRHSEKELMVQKLETMADITTDPKTKRAIEQCITKLEQ